MGAHKMLINISTGHDFCQGVLNKKGFWIAGLRFILDRAEQKAMDSQWAVGL